jgi:hypothetical protein
MAALISQPVFLMFYVLLYIYYICHFCDAPTDFFVASAVTKEGNWKSERQNVVVESQASPLPCDECDEKYNKGGGSGRRWGGGWGSNNKATVPYTGERVGMRPN